MSYNFVENKYAFDDPNVNLNFDDDITYQYLNGDYDIDATTDVVPNVTPDVPPIPSSEKKKDVDYKKERSIASNSVYTMFIIIAILIIVLWYVYRNSQIKEEVLEISTAEPQLVTFI